MAVIYFMSGLSFCSLGLAAYLQYRRADEFQLRLQLPWLAGFAFVSAASGWVSMFLVSETNGQMVEILEVARDVAQPLSGLLLLIFGWGMFAHLLPLPSWTIIIPGVLMVPIAFVTTYALSTFVTPSPIQIPIEIWSRYLLYLPGSILAGLGFLRQWHRQRMLGFPDVASLMLGAGLAFLFEACVMGLVVPAAPYGPASYYNYDRVSYNAFSDASGGIGPSIGLTAWLDYSQVLRVTHLPIEFWRMLSAFAVTGFVVRGLDVFARLQEHLLQSLREEGDRSRQAALDAQIVARQTAENWSDALVRISSLVAELEDVDRILLYIVETARQLLKVDFIGLALLQDDPDCLRLKYFAVPESSAVVDEPVAVENPLITSVLRTRASWCNAADGPPEEFRSVCFSTGESARALAVVPLNLDHQTIGALWAARFAQSPLSDTDLIWLECLADQVLIALKHGLMTSQLQSLSITTERSRIAREMHDGVAQVLGYLNLQLQTLDAFLQQGKLDRLHQNMEQMREAVQAAQADVRENILSLRTTLANEKGVVPAIEEYLEEFGIQTQIDTHFVNRAGDELDLASIAEVQLVCILQEALANVRKHAHASKVVVELSRHAQEGAEYLQLMVEDDGAGFTPVRQKRNFGLQTMNERAQSVGGMLVVWTQPGQGVRIQCRIPCLSKQVLAKPKAIVLP